MSEFLTPHSIANTIRMKATQYSGMFLIVEGPDDARMFKNFVIEENCKIEIAFGKNNATEALKLLAATDFDQVLAIVDRDYDTVLGNLQQTEHLFLTDTHDLETLIVKSHAFNKLVAEYMDEERLREFEKRRHKELRQILLDSAYFIGLVRCVSIKHRLNISFKDIELNRVLDRETLQIDKTAFLRQVVKNSNVVEVKFEDLQEKIEHLHQEKHDPWIIARGHDLVEVLHNALQLVGYRRSQRLSISMLESSLRLSYSFDAFKQTVLYRNIKEWEKKRSVKKFFR
ncbi:MAG TPA: DUF4435 domain-containing protein [bacterium]|nr:DUF4435 domain-containing protein [bacterium]HNT66028.1 DUF4435 domain-containing protein [bacterium]